MAVCLKKNKVGIIAEAFSDGGKYEHDETDQRF